MNLESQVVNLELSKKLKVNGFPQEGFWLWKTQNSEPYLVYFNSRYRHSKGKILCVAPTVAELGEALPEIVRLPYLLNNRNIGGRKWYLVMNPVNGRNNVIIADTEANARAKMLLYLVKEGLIKGEYAPKRSQR